MTTITKKLLAIVLFLNLIITTLHPEIISQLSNKNLTISGYFFSSTKSSYFLRYMNENNSSLWLYTKQRKFKPIHNTKAYDGYDKAGILFKSIMIDSNNRISISSTINNSNYLYEDISNKTFTPTHLLLKDNNKNNNSNYNVLANKNATSLWEYKNRKYRPIHNARAYDGYEEAKKIFDDINITKDNTVHIGDIDTVNYTSFKTKEYSLNNTRAIKIVKSSDYKDNFIQLNNNLIKDKANELIWHNNNDGKLRTYQEAKAYCENLEISGYDRFRLPSGLESFSLFDKKIKLSHLKQFNIKVDSLYWTSHWIYHNPKENIYNAHKFKIITNEENDTLRFNLHSYWVGKIPSANTICVTGKDIIKPVLLRDNKKEVVKDLNNALMWQDNVPLRRSIRISELDNYCSSNYLGGFKDWRYPDFQEFFTIFYSKKLIYKIPIFNNFTIAYQTNINDNFSDETQKDIISSTDSMWRDMSYEEIFDKFDKKDTKKILSYYSNQSKDEILLKNVFDIKQARNEKILPIQKKINDLEALKPITKDNYKQILLQKKADEDIEKDILGAPLTSKAQSMIVTKYYILNDIMKKAKREGYDLSRIKMQSSLMAEIDLLRIEILFFNNKSYDAYKEDFLISKLIYSRRYQFNFIIQDEDKKYFYYSYVDNKKSSIDMIKSKSPSTLVSAICVRKIQ